MCAQLAKSIVHILVIYAKLIPTGYCHTLYYCLNKFTNNLCTTYSYCNLILYVYVPYIVCPYFLLRENPLFFHIFIWSSLFYGVEHKLYYRRQKQKINVKNFDFIYYLGTNFLFCLSLKKKNLHRIPPTKFQIP